MKFEFRYESLKRTVSLILFAYNMLIECSEIIEKIIPGNVFEQKKTKPALKFNSGLALIGLRAAGSRTLSLSLIICVPSLPFGECSSGKNCN